MGSVDEAEDLVQETYLRAWRACAGFEGRSSVRSWLYRIATNACLSAIEKRERRALPSGLGVPGTSPATPLEPAGPGISWLQPIPGHRVGSESDDPAVIVARRDSLRLALIAGLQYLPPRQRAVLILRDVLDWPAAEVAEMLDTSTAAVKSMLQRARVRLERIAPDDDQRVDEPTEPASLALLNQYIAAFENAAHQGQRAGRRGLLPQRSGRRSSGLRVAVVTTTSTGISAITVFGDADLVTKFGFPQIAPARSAPAPAWPPSRPTGTSPCSGSPAPAPCGSANA